MMRRVIAAFLLLLLGLQTTGSSALAAPRISSVTPSLFAEIGTAFGAIFNALEETQVVAMLTGYGDRWAAVHAPRPRKVIIIPVARPRLRLMKIGRIALPAWGRVVTPRVLLRPIDPRFAPRDPMARKSGQNAMQAVHLSARMSTAHAPMSTMTIGGGGGSSYSIVVSPSPLTLANGTSQSVAINCYTNRQYTDCGSASASSDDPNVADVAVDDTGNTSTVVANATGTATITYTWNGATASLPVTIVDATPTPQPTATPLATPTPQPTPTPTSTSTPTPQSTLAPATTGVNHWWTYEEGSVPGVGKYMVNVGNGNLLVQSDDVDIPERGIDLAFRRTYNSQSQHDAANTDNSVPSNFGNGWTNTFDAHIARYNNGTTLSVYDIDGARYDYTASGSAWLPPPGMQGTQLTLATNASYNNGCYYQWTKKNGTAYMFYAPSYASQTCAAAGAGAGLNGRIAEIAARNNNNYVIFTYSWQNGIVDGGHLGSITATHADGQQLILAFAKTDSSSPCDGNGPCELQSITRPDGQAVTYAYDSSGDLTQVNLPGNNVASTLSETLSYTSPYLISQIANPRYTYSYAQTSGNPNDGTTTNFTFFPVTRQLQLMRRAGFVNFTPNDGTGTPLQQLNQQSGDQTPTYYQQAYSGYTTTNCTVGVNSTGSAVIVLDSGTAATATMSDSDGHSKTYSTDACWRLNQIQESTGALYLVTTQGWDASNELVWSVEPRGNAPGAVASTYETDYAYDANGNTIAVAQPSVATNAGTLRPTALYSYDTYNNVLAYCDPIKVGSVGYDWVNRPQSDSLCVPGAGVTRYQWDTTDPVEPYGRLSGTFTPLGYHRTIAYDSTAQGGGDYGLPTSIKGDAITQTIDQSTATRQPQLSIVYDSHGNALCYSTYQDTGGALRWSRAAYDGLNRRTATADADDDSLSVSQCANTAGIAHSHIESATTYYNNGQVASTQSPAEYAAGVSTAFSYDSDGNEVSIVTHYGCITGGNCPAQTTSKWYDGADRLVEVQQPSDQSGHDLYAYPFRTRYLYDLSSGGTVGIDGSVFHAYGNLFKTQQYGPSNPIVAANQPPAATTWVDVRGSSFDALDRVLSSFEPAFGTVAKSTNTYDAAGNSGLLSSSSDALGEQKVYSYTATGWTSAKNYSGDSGVTPSETYAFDPDGRTIAITSSTLGTENKSYDADGRLVSDQEPLGGGDSTPATVTYSYYADGLRSALSVASNSINKSNIFQYGYRADGLEEVRNVNYANAFSFGWTYTAAGKPLTERDPFYGNTVQLIGQDGITVAGTRVFGDKQFTYDLYGRISSLTLPEGYAYNAMAYDAEGQRLSYGRTSAFCYSPDNCNPTRTNVFTSRGELVKETESGTVSPLTNSYGANGFMCQALNSSPPTCSEGYDSRDAMLLQDQVAYSYDSAGRQTQIQSAGSGDSQNPSTAPLVRAYDAENHLVSFSVSGSQGTNFWCTHDNAQMCDSPMQNTYGYLSAGRTSTYAWGASGHLSSIQSPSTGFTPKSFLHWDGDELLFYSTEGSTNTELHVGDIGIENNGYLYVTDRDMDGVQVATHDSGSFSAWAGMPAGHPTMKGRTVSGSQPSTPAWSAPVEGLTHVRKDGYADAYGNTFQGVRVYDQNIGQWITPDAYAGDVQDPMSQKPFMWNGNNPLEYSDPSGYLIQFAGDKDQQKQEQADFDAVKAYFKDDKEALGILNDLETNTSFTVTISENSDKTDDFNGRADTIDWDPRGMLSVDGGGAQSPAMVLLHEAAHADRANNDILGYEHDADPKHVVAGHDTAEERRVISGVERRAAQATGESVRTDHTGTICHTSSVIGTTPTESCN